MPPIQCEYCMSASVETNGESIRCLNCGHTWQPENIYANQQDMDAQAMQNPPLIVTRKTTTGRLSGNILFREEQVDSETINGIETALSHDFSQASGGFLIHDPKDVLGRCNICGGILHQNGHFKCEYHSSHELLCPRHTYKWSGKTICRRGFYLNIASAIFLFPFKLLVQILGLIFLKE